VRAREVYAYCISPVFSDRAAVAPNTTMVSFMCWVYIEDSGKKTAEQNIHTITYGNPIYF